MLTHTACKDLQISDEQELDYTFSQTEGTPVRYLRIIALLITCIPVVSCGGYYFVGFVSNPGGTSTVTGTVSAVSGGLVSAPSGLNSITAVTFINSDVAQTVNFCGDRQALFPLNKTVRTDYTAGVFCSVLKRVIIVNETVNSQNGN
jgi:hypothetical protein